MLQLHLLWKVDTLLMPVRAISCVSYSIRSPLIFDNTLFYRRPIVVGFCPSSLFFCRATHPRESEPPGCPEHLFVASIPCHYATWNRCHSASPTDPSLRRIGQDSAGSKRWGTQRKARSQMTGFRTDRGAIARPSGTGKHCGYAPCCVFRSISKSALKRKM